jgi:heavy metal efflux system protein
VRIALDSNLTVKMSSFSVEEQKALKGASWDLPKTSIDGQYGQFNSYMNDNSFTVSQSIDFPAVYISQNKLAKANVKSSEWQLKESQLDIATRVKQVYWQLAYLHSKRILYAYQDSLFAGFLRAAELRAKTGETNKLEMINARSQSLEVSNLLQQVKADIDIYSLKFQNLLNITGEIVITDTVLRRADMLLSADSAALDANPTLKYMEQQVEVSRLEKRTELNRLWPDLSIGYFSQTMQGSQEVDGLQQTFGNDDRFTGFQAGIAVPLWFGPYTARAKAAAIREEAAKVNAEYYSSLISGNYRSLLAEYSKYNTSLEYYEQQAIPEAGLIVGQAAKSYKAGAMDYLEYILNLNRALQIRLNYLDALNNYNQTIINIEYITGKIF